MRFYILLYIAVLLFSGCSIMEYSEGPCPDIDIEESEYINFSFRIVSQSGNSTRIDNFHEEVDSENPSFEDRIYTDDLVFLLYAGGLSATDLSFIAKIDNLSQNNDPRSSISGGPLIYTVRLSISKTDLDRIVPDSDEDVNFRFVSFANTNNEYSQLTEEQYSTFNNLITAASEWNFKINEVIYSGTGGLRQNARIPMFGSVGLSVIRERLNKANLGNPIIGEDMHLLRSVAKLRVIDNITERDENGLPRIEAVTFTGIPIGYTLPGDAGSYVNGFQVESPNPYEGVGEEPVERMTINLPRDAKDHDRFIIYIPEQYISGPKLTIKVTYSLNEDNTPAEQKNFEVPLSGYNGIIFSNYGEAFLRNHIYTLSVKDARSSQLNLNVAVKNWKNINYEYEYY